MSEHLAAFVCGASLVVAFGLCSACSGGDDEASEDERAAAEEEFSTVPQVPGPGVQRARHRLVEVGVTVAQNKRSGAVWDEPTPEPDPRIEVYLAGKRVAVCDADDTYEAACELDATLDLKNASTIEFKVIDRDIRADDRIGEARLTDLHTRGTRGQRLPMEVKGQLRSAYFRLGEPLTWLDRYKNRIIGAVIGLFAGLLLWFAFESFWLRHRSDDDDDDDDGYHDGDEGGDRAPVQHAPQTVGGRPESAPSHGAQTVTPVEPKKIYRVRCDSCGATSTTEHDTCAYCGESLLEEKARNEVQS